MSEKGTYRLTYYRWPKEVVVKLRLFFWSSIKKMLQMMPFGEILNIFFALKF